VQERSYLCRALIEQIILGLRTFSSLFLLLLLFQALGVKVSLPLTGSFRVPRFVQSEVPLLLAIRVYF